MHACLESLYDYRQQQQLCSKNLLKMQCSQCGDVYTFIFTLQPESSDLWWPIQLTGHSWWRLALLHQRAMELSCHTAWMQRHSHLWHSWTCTAHTKIHSHVENLIPVTACPARVFQLQVTNVYCSSISVGSTIQVWGSAQHQQFLIVKHTPQTCTDVVV